MSVILYVLGGLAVMIGAGLVGFGVPIKEFGIGNTLILSGVMMFCTGLVMVGLAATLAHLVRLSDMLATRAPVRDARAAEPFDRGSGAAPSGAGDGRIPFPSRAKQSPQVPPVADARPPAAPQPGDMTGEMASHGLGQGAGPGGAPSIAPSLRNPDLTAHEARGEAPARPEATPQPGLEPDLNLPPPPPLPPPAPSAFARPSAPQMPPPPPRPAPTMRPPQANYFDTVWPADAKSDARPDARPEPKPEFKPEPKFDARPDVSANGNGDLRPVPRFEAPPPDVPVPSPAVAPAPSAPGPDLPAGGEEMRAAAVLKSGVVDGMAYTLYVDGSIEAELPDGTLRFASINALREHLERGGA